MNDSVALAKIALQKAAAWVGPHIILEISSLGKLEAAICSLHVPSAFHGRALLSLHPDAALSL